MQMFSSGSQSTVSPSLRSVKAEAEGRTSTSSKSPRTGNITVSSSWYPSSRRRNTSSPRLILQFALRIIVEQRYEKVAANGRHGPKFLPDALSASSGKASPEPFRPTIKGLSELFPSCPERPPGPLRDRGPGGNSPATESRCRRPSEGANAKIFAEFGP